MLDAAWRLCQGAGRQMLEQQGGGRIINVSSAWGYRGGRDTFMYPIAKAGIISFTKSLAMTYAQDGIRASCIAPGMFPRPDATERIAQLAKVLDKD